MTDKNTNSPTVETRPCQSLGAATGSVWFPIATPPPQKSDLLAYWQDDDPKFEGVYGLVTRSGDDYMDADTGRLMTKPTYWMPVPAPPNT